MSAQETKTTPLNSTLKVLSMHIKPGQEIEALHIEERGTYNWFVSDNPHSRPDQIWVRGPANVLQRFFDLLKYDGFSRHGDHTWYFNSRGEADRFVNVIRLFPELSYWQLGLSPQYAVTANYPLLGYHCVTMLDFRNAVEEGKRQEKMRAAVHELMREKHPDFFNRTHVSVVVADCGGNGPATMNYRGMIEHCANYGQVPNHPRSYYVLFDHPSAGQTCFTDYASRGGFDRVWRFGVV